MAMGPRTKRPHTCEDAIVIRRLPIAAAKTLFSISDARVVYVDRFFYRGAEYSGYLLARIPPHVYNSLRLPKTYLRVYLKWFNWRPRTTGTCRITLLSTVKLLPDDIEEDVITDLGLVLADAFRPP